MTDIPAVFWMIIISILSGIIFFVFLYVVLLLRELISTVKNTNEIIEEAKDIVSSTVDILDETREVVSDVRQTTNQITSTVSEINQTVIEPVRHVAGVIATVGNFVSRFRRGGDNKEE